MQFISQTIHVRCGGGTRGPAKSARHLCSYREPGSAILSRWNQRNVAMGGKIPARLAGRYRSAKFGGNYASNLVPESEAGAHGCDLVLYLDNDGYVQESGTMNIFAITSEGELVTPSLGTILEGVTRASILSLATAHGLT